jgi:hypothetical protein
LNWRSRKLRRATIGWNFKLMLILALSYKWLQWHSDAGC